MSSTATHVNGVLHLYARPIGLLQRDATTVMEHVTSFRRHSRFRVWELNTRFGFPTALSRLRFDAVILHYSLFGPRAYDLDDEFRRYLKGTCSESYKIAMFQDEFHFCRDRFAFLNEFEIDCIYSLLDPEYYETVYGRNTNVPLVITYLTGYVSDELRSAGNRFGLPQERRSIDIGYRARKVAPYIGREAQEKYEVGVRFRERAEGLGLNLDIGFSESERLYGDDWYRFIGRCKAVLGAEAGVGTYDLEDKVYAEYEQLIASGREPTAEEMESGPIARWGLRLPNRVVSPRHFEAAALGTAQILYEGWFNGVMKPGVHFLELRKDFSNFDDVIDGLRDEALRRRIAERAKRDLIDSDDYTYESFVAGFDRTLLAAGLDPEISEADRLYVDRELERGRRRRAVRARARDLEVRSRSVEFPGKPMLKTLLRPALRRFDSVRGHGTPPDGR